MNPLYQQALSGTLSSPGGNSITNTFLNSCIIPIDIFRCNSDGTLSCVDSGLVPSGTIQTQNWGAQENDYYVVQSNLSGAFMMAFQLTSSSPDPIEISSDQLCSPNDVGAIPQSTSTMVLPPDTPSVLVGIGMLPQGNIIVTREQYWARSGDSYSVGPGETREINFTQTSGKQKTSSTESNINASINVQAGAGFGPFSASVSAALTTSSSQMQQVAINEESTSYVSQKLANVSETDPIIVLKWQLMDTINGFSTNQSTSDGPVFSVQSAQSPVVISTVTSGASAGELKQPKISESAATQDAAIKQFARKRQMELYKKATSKKINK